MDPILVGMLALLLGLFGGAMIASTLMASACKETIRLMVRLPVTVQVYRKLGGESWKPDDWEEEDGEDGGEFLC